MFESDNGYKKVCIWKDEIPFNCVSNNSLYLCVESGNISWHVGTICIEAKLHPRHISNYAMVGMRYLNDKKSKTDIVVNYEGKKILCQSQVLPFNKDIYVGLDKEFADAIKGFFDEYPIRKLPAGTIEIFTGGYDEVGSSNISFKKVMELLIFVFKNIDELNCMDLKSELLKLM